MGYQKEYQEKLTTAEAVAGMVQSGEGIKLGYFTAKPVVLIQEVAKRHEELKDVLFVACSTAPPVPEVIQYKESFDWQDWHWSALTRILANYYDNIVYAPITYHMC